MGPGASQRGARILIILVFFFFRGMGGEGGQRRSVKCTAHKSFACGMGEGECFWGLGIRALFHGAGKERRAAASRGEH